MKLSKIMYRVSDVNYDIFTRCLYSDKELIKYLSQHKDKKIIVHLTDAAYFDIEGNRLDSEGKKYDKL
jgi:hypothetical protein